MLRRWVFQVMDVIELASPVLRQAQDKRFGIILMAVQSLSYLPQEEVGPIQIVPVYPPGSPFR